MLKLLLLIVFAAIIISLLRAFYFLITKTEPGHKVVNALIVRVVLSLLLVSLLLFGFFTGQLQPYGP